MSDYSGTFPYPKPNNLPIVSLEALVRHISPFREPGQRIRVIQALHAATGGTPDGLAIAVRWCSQWRNYPGADEIAKRWQLIADDTGNPESASTLCELAEGSGFDWVDVCGQAEPGFEIVDSDVVESIEEPATLLSRFSLTGQSAALEREAIEQVPILEGLALLGQATVIFAPPNSGKTLLTLWLLIDTVRRGAIDPARTYYLNLDDSLAGLIEKLRLAEEFKFQMIAEGYRAFTANDFVAILSKITSDGDARGVVLVVDVLKKVVDVMHKGASTGFGKVFRRFVLQGGTCIFLAHTNKRPDNDGRPVYAGTSDILEDVDAAHTLQVISDSNAREKVVAFECIKRRGNIRQRALYGYSAEEGLSYEELLASVRPIADQELDAIRRVEEFKSDAELIDTARACIQAGIRTKMLLAAEIATRSGCSKREAIRFVEKYTGDDAERHHWTFDVRQRGAKSYRLLAGGEADSHSGA